MADSERSGRDLPGAREAISLIITGRLKARVTVTRIPGTRRDICRPVILVNQTEYEVLAEDDRATAFTEINPGEKLRVLGTLRRTSWETADGTTHQRLEIVAEGLIRHARRPQVGDGKEETPR